MPWPPFGSWKLKDSGEGIEFQKLLEGKTVPEIKDLIEDQDYILIGKCVAAFQHLEDTMIAVISRYFGTNTLPLIWALLAESRFAEILQSLRRINEVNQLCDKAKMKIVCSYTIKVCEHRNILVHSLIPGSSRPDGGIQIMNKRKGHGRLDRKQLEEFVEQTKQLDSFIRHLLLPPPH